MEEANIQRKIYRLLGSMGYVCIPQTDAFKCSRCGEITRPPKGRPDLPVLHPTSRSIVVEVKVLRAENRSFSFSKITDEQRAWLDFWEGIQGIGFIGLGIIQRHGKLDYLEHLYLIPWNRWKEMEERIAPYQLSIPLEAGKGFKTELQEQQLDILHIFTPYEIKREDASWLLPLVLKEELCIQ